MTFPFGVQLSHDNRVVCRFTDCAREKKSSFRISFFLINQLVSNV